MFSAIPTVPILFFTRSRRDSDSLKKSGLCWWPFRPLSRLLIEGFVLVVCVRVCCYIHNSRKMQSLLGGMKSVHVKICTAVNQQQQDQDLDLALSGSYCGMIDKPWNHQPGRRWPLQGKLLKPRTGPEFLVCMNILFEDAIQIQVTISAMHSCAGCLQTLEVINNTIHWSNLGSGISGKMEPMANT